jgi:DNA (cytosine-5)-methyltransferase 1
LNKKYTAIDLFSGCGGFSQGFLKAGFEIMAASEIWEPAVLSYKFNHRDIRVIEGDITDPEIKSELFQIIDGTRVNVIIGGPPCQGYSIAGNRNPDDPRGQLYLDFVEIIEHFKPDFFVMENVKGLLHMKHVKPDLKQEGLKEFKTNCEKLQRYKDLKRFGAQRALDKKEQEEFEALKRKRSEIQKGIDANLIPLIDKILAKFKEINYKVSWHVLNSADYGVSQTRERIIFIGTKHENLELKFPTKTHAKNQEQTTIEDFTETKGDNKLKKWTTAGEVLKKYENWAENADSNHLFTKHKKEFVKKLHDTQIGENVYKNYSDAWWRLDPDKPARTVKENHGGVFVHYKFDRVCTPRELAALQSFDDNFIFQGTKSAILKQIGNAVPPLMAKAIADQIRASLKEIE